MATPPRHTHDRLPLARLAIVHCAYIGMVWLCVQLVSTAAGQQPGMTTVFAATAGQPAVTTTLFLPVIVHSAALTACNPITTETYSTVTVNPPPTDRPAELHADLNLGLRGYTPTTAFLGLVDISGPTDPTTPPQFPSFFGDQRTPTFTSVFRVYNWNYLPPPNPGTRGSPITNPPVTLLGMGMTPGEIVRVPHSGYSIGSGYEVLVLYAAPDRITLKYTRDDNVVNGYTIHVEQVCVEPSLLALYQTWNSAGRAHLPALHDGQPFGRAQGTEIAVGIQDNGAWLDPRSRKDWWQGR